MALYGTHDAGQSPEVEVLDVLLGHGFVRDPAVFGLYKNEKTRRHVVDHCGDFFVAGNQEGTKFVLDVLRTKFFVNDRAGLRFGWCFERRAARPSSAKPMTGRHPSFQSICASWGISAPQPQRLASVTATA